MYIPNTQKNKASGNTIATCNKHTRKRGGEEESLPCSPSPSLSALMAATYRGGEKTAKGAGAVINRCAHARRKPETEIHCENGNNLQSPGKNGLH